MPRHASRVRYEHLESRILFHGGQIMNEGKISYLAKYYGSYTVLSQINQYHLLGDPATHLIVPKSQAQLQIDPALPQKQDGLHVKATCPFPKGNGWFDLLTPDQNLRIRQQINIEKKSIESDESKVNLISAIGYFN